MKLKELAPGTKFQWRRQGNSKIHEVVDGPAGVYRTVGRFVSGEAELKHPCPAKLPDCAEHPIVDLKENPEKDAKVVKGHLL